MASTSTPPPQQAETSCLHKIGWTNRWIWKPDCLLARRCAAWRTRAQVRGANVFDRVTQGQDSPGSPRLNHKEQTRHQHERQMLDVKHSARHLSATHRQIKLFKFIPAVDILSFKMKSWNRNPIRGNMTTRLWLSSAPAWLKDAQQLKHPLLPKASNKLF